MICPSCGARVKLSLVLDEDIDGDNKTINFILNKKHCSLSRKDVFEAASSIDFPKAYQQFYVQLPDREGQTQDYPIKQVVRKALGKKYGDEYPGEFNALQAKSYLERLGFTVLVRK